LRRGGDKIPHPNPPLAKGRGQDSGFPPLQGGIKGGKFPALREIPVSPLSKGGLRGVKFPALREIPVSPLSKGGLRGVNHY